MNLSRLAEIEELRGSAFDSDIKRILTSSFNKLNPDDKNKYLNERMNLLRSDYQTDDEIAELFVFLDKMDRYEDVMTLIVLHSDLMEEYFHESQSYCKYNIQYKWDKNISNFALKDQLLTDLKEISEDLDKYNKLKILVIDKILVNSA